VGTRPIGCPSIAYFLDLARTDRGFRTGRHLRGWLVSFVLCLLGSQSFAQQRETPTIVASRAMPWVWRLRDVRFGSKTKHWELGDCLDVEIALREYKPHSAGRRRGRKLAAPAIKH
jgi:hypothetical protein